MTTGDKLADLLNTAQRATAASDELLAINRRLLSLAMAGLHLYKAALTPSPAGLAAACRAYAQVVEAKE